MVITSSSTLIKKEVVYVDAYVYVYVWREEIDGAKLYIYIYCHKKHTYVMILMSSYGTLDRVDEIKSRSYVSNVENIQKQLKYNEVGILFYTERRNRWS